MQGQYKALWLDKDNNLVVLDQRVLPFEETTVTITNTQETIEAIKNMVGQVLLEMWLDLESIWLVESQMEILKN